MSNDVLRILLYGYESTKSLNIPDMDLFGVLREKHALPIGLDMIGGQFLCQHVNKRSQHNLNLNYEGNSVEERIPVAWELSKNSPIKDRILQRIEAISKARGVRREF